MLVYIAVVIAGQLKLAAAFQTIVDSQDRIICGTGHAGHIGCMYVVQYEINAGQNVIDRHFQTAIGHFLSEYHGILQLCQNILYRKIVFC